MRSVCPVSQLQPEETLPEPVLFSACAHAGVLNGNVSTFQIFDTHVDADSMAHTFVSISFIYLVFSFSWVIAVSFLSSCCFWLTTMFVSCLSARTTFPMLSRQTSGARKATHQKRTFHWRARRVSSFPHDNSECNHHIECIPNDWKWNGNWQPFFGLAFWRATTIDRNHWRKLVKFWRS